MATELTTQECERLHVCETTIKNGLSTFREVGEALLEIREGRLYKQDFRTFEAYCQERWEFGRVQAHRLIVASRTAKGTDKVLPTGQQSVSNERQARALADVPEADRRAVLDEASKDGKPTAKKIREAAEALNPTEQPDDGLTEKARAAVAKSEEFREAMKLISKVKGIVKALGDDPFGHRLHVSQILTDLGHAYGGIKFGAPHASCGPCGDKPTKACKACAGLGWLTKTIMEAMPAKDQKKCVVFVDIE